MWVSWHQKLLYEGTVVQRHVKTSVQSSSSNNLTLYTLASLCIFSTLFSKFFLSADKEKLFNSHALASTRGEQNVVESRGSAGNNTDHAKPQSIFLLPQYRRQVKRVFQCVTLAWRVDASSVVCSLIDNGKLADHWDCDIIASCGKIEVNRQRRTGGFSFFAFHLPKAMQANLCISQNIHRPWRDSRQGLSNQSTNRIEHA